MQELQVFVGVDVAKAELVVARHGQTGSRTIPNQAQAISAWLRELPDGACLAMESTGRYHQMLASLAQAAGLQVFVLNARDVHFYAKALGARAKTDRLDAHVIARYAAEQHTRLHRWIAPCPALQQVRSLLGQRWAVVSKRTALRQSLQGARRCASRCRAVMVRSRSKSRPWRRALLRCSRQSTRASWRCWGRMAVCARGSVCCKASWV